MALFLVLEDFEAGRTKINAGDVIDDGQYNLTQLGPAGLATAPFVAAMQPAIDAYQAQKRSGRPEAEGDLHTLILASLQGAGTVGYDDALVGPPFVATDVQAALDVIKGGLAPAVHAPTHAPATGSDPLATAAANTVTVGAAPAVGVADTLSRADHVHGLGSAVPTGTVQAGQAAVEGTDTTAARTDHAHPVSTAILGDLGAQVVGVGAAGAAAELPRADHVHPMASAAPVDTGTANAEGAAGTVARSDHVHDIGNATLAPVHQAVADGDGLSDLSTIRVAFAAGGGGAPDDVTIYSSNAPFLFRIVDVQVMVSTLIAASTVQLRDTAGGAGSALSDAFDSATVGRKRDTGIAGANVSPSVPASGSVFIRRSDNGVAGEAILFIRRET